MRAGPPAANDHPPGEVTSVRGGPADAVTRLTWPLGPGQRQARTSDTRTLLRQDPAGRKAQPAMPAAARPAPMKHEEPVRDHEGRLARALPVQSTAQNGGFTPKSGGDLLDGRQWKQFPRAVAGAMWGRFCGPPQKSTPPRRRSKRPCGRVRC